MGVYIQIMMKTGFQKVKLSRNTSAKSNSSKGIETLKEDKTDKLVELRVKIEKQREIMRQSGKRFTKGVSSTNSIKNIQTAGGPKYAEKTANSGFAKKEQKVESACIGGEQKLEVVNSKPVARETVDLTSLALQPQHVSMTSSRLFQKQLAHQKDRNREVQDFLEKLGLKKFSEGLISLGYDELEVLLEVSSEQLNFLMMRASQQRVLTEALNQHKVQHGLSLDKLMTDSFAKTTSQFRLKVKNEVVREKESEGRNFNISRPKSALTVASTTPTNNSGLFGVNSGVEPNTSFFIGIGGQSWSMDCLVRRACSTCFKVFPGGDLLQEGESYYCKLCREKEDDPMSISLNASMVRDYKK